MFTCNPCRRARPGYRPQREHRAPRAWVCIVCGTPCETRRGPAGKYCSLHRPIRSRAKYHRINCDACGKATITTGRHCADCRNIGAWRFKSRNMQTTRTRNTWRDEDRARAAGVPFEHVDRLTVYIRDYWICGICGGCIDLAHDYPDPDTATLDHVVPISRGGPHTYTQCAHLACNVYKNDQLHPPGHFSADTHPAPDCRGSRLIYRGLRKDPGPR
jgi:hypothetical protein